MAEKHYTTRPENVQEGVTYRDEMVTPTPPLSQRATVAPATPSYRPVPPGGQHVSSDYQSGWNTASGFQGVQSEWDTASSFQGGESGWNESSGFQRSPTAPSGQTGFYRMPSGQTGYTVDPDQYVNQSSLSGLQGRYRSVGQIPTYYSQQYSVTSEETGASGFQRPNVAQGGQTAQSDSQGPYTVPENQEGASGYSSGAHPQNLYQTSNSASVRNFFPASMAASGRPGYRVGHLPTIDPESGSEGVSGDDDDDEDMPQVMTMPSSSGQSHRRSSGRAFAVIA